MSRTPLLVGAAALALPLLSADRVGQAHDLSPKFSEGQELTIRTEFVASFGLDDATAKMGEMELIPEVPTVDVEVEGINEYSETILGASNGAITKLRRTHVEENYSVTGEAGMQGQYQDFDESQEGPLSGRTLELTKTDEGWDVEDVTEDAGSLDEAGEMGLALTTEKTHMEQLLPSRPVEVGGTWDVGEAMFEEMQRVMSAAAAEDSEMAPMMGMVESLQESMEFEAKGKLVSVDDGMARIEWTLEAELIIDDLFGMVREVMDPDMAGEIPEDADGGLEFAVELTGTGVFDMEAHQLVEAALEGEFALSGEFAMSQQGTTIEASADASGTIEVNTTIEIQ